MTARVITRLVTAAALIFFLGFLGVWLLLNRGVVAGLTAHPRQAIAEFAVAAAFVVWSLWCVAHGDPLIRRAVGRLFRVRIEIEYVEQARWTFQAHTADGKKAGFVRDRVSGIVMVVIWFLALLVMPAALAAVVLMWAGGITPSEMFGR